MCGVNQKFNLQSFRLLIPIRSPLERCTPHDAAMIFRWRNVLSSNDLLERLLWLDEHPFRSRQTPSTGFHVRLLPPGCVSCTLLAHQETDDTKLLHQSLAWTTGLVHCQDCLAFAFFGCQPFTGLSAPNLPNHRGGTDEQSLLFGDISCKMTRGMGFNVSSDRRIASRLGNSHLRMWMRSGHSSNNTSPRQGTESSQSGEDSVLWELLVCVWLRVECCSAVCCQSNDQTKKTIV